LKKEAYIYFKVKEIPEGQNGIVIRNRRIVFADALHDQVTQAIDELGL
jgi:hypothetical protein